MFQEENRIKKRRNIQQGCCRKFTTTTTSHPKFMFNKINHWKKGMTISRNGGILGG